MIYEGRTLAEISEILEWNRMPNIKELGMQNTTRIYLGAAQSNLLSALKEESEHGMSTEQVKEFSEATEAVDRLLKRFTGPVVSVRPYCEQQADAMEYAAERAAEESFGNRSAV